MNIQWHRKWGWIALFFLLAGCSTTAPTDKNTQSQIDLNDPIALIQAADSSEGATQNRYRLLAVEAAIQKQFWDTAEQQILLIPAPLDDPKLQNRWLLFSAILADHQDQIRRTQAYLQSIDSKQLSYEQKQQLLTLLQAYKANPVHILELEITLYPQSLHKADEERERIWQQLQRLSPEQTQRLAATNHKQVSGWLAFQTLMLESTNVRELQTRLDAWEQSYASHPARQLLPKDLGSMLPTIGSAQKVAVMLPLSGRYRLQGEAIRDGMIASLLDSYENQSELYFFDTEGQDLALLVQQIQMQEFQLIVGPLLKSRAKLVLNDPERTLPLLMLNHPDDTSLLGKQAFWFALSPEQEARMMAEWLIQQGTETPLLFVAGGKSYQRMSEAFAEYWQDHGTWGTEPMIRNLPKGNAMKDAMIQAFGVDASKARQKGLIKVTETDLAFEARSRRDIDAVYLLAPADHARLAKTFLDVTVNPYANDFPIYIGSRSHQGYHTELESVWVMDIPMLIDERAESEWQELFPQWRYQEARLFAMGHDVFTLVPQLKSLASLPGLSIPGLTGELSLLANGEVRHQPSVAQYKKGKLHLSSN